LRKQRGKQPGLSDRQVREAVESTRECEVAQFVVWVGLPCLVTKARSCELHVQLRRVSRTTRDNIFNGSSFDQCPCIGF
jgi:hypothetical protein